MGQISHRQSVTGPEQLDMLRWTADPDHPPEAAARRKTAASKASLGKGVEYGTVWERFHNERLNMPRPKG